MNKKENSVKKLLFGFALSFSINSFATCLDSLPMTPMARDIQFKTIKSQLSSSREAVKLYAELASDTQNTNDLSAMAASAAIPLVAVGSLYFMPPLLGITQAATFIYESERATASLIFLSTLLAPTVATGYITIDSIIDSLKKQNINEDIIMNFEKKVQESRIQDCSYAKSFKELEALKEGVFNNEFDGSVKNLILDHVLLGSVSRDGAHKLYAIALIKTALLEKQALELEHLSY